MSDGLRVAQLEVLITGLRADISRLERELATETAKRIRAEAARDREARLAQRWREVFREIARKRLVEEQRRAMRNAR